MALTSPAVSSKHAAPITPETTTGAAFLSKEKPLNAALTALEDAPPGAEPSLIPLDTISYFRSPRSQARTLPLGPEPTTPKLNHAPGEGSSPADRAKALEGPLEEQKLAGPGVTAPLDTVRNFATEEGRVAASQAEREASAYRQSGPSQGKGSLKGLETAVGAFKEEADVIGEKAMIEPEKITYWRHPRVADPSNNAPTALAALPSLLTSQAKGVEAQIGKAVETLEEDVDGEKALIEPEKITYWRQDRVTDPAKYAQAAFTGLPPVIINQEKGVEAQLGKAVETLEEDIQGGKALIEPDKITYWTPGRVADPVKYAAATVAALPATLKDIGLGIANPHATPDAALPPVLAGPAPPIPPRKATQGYASSEYSDYRSSTISFHSSAATLSSGQRRPRPEVRNVVSSPYL